MSSRQQSPLELGSMASQASATTSSTVLPNAFNRLMQTDSLPAVKRDRCLRLPPTYNRNYDPFKPRPEDLPGGYSPYTFGEPLYDDRPVIIARLPLHCIVAGPTKKPRTQWV
jgi:hypothetical protein